MTSCADQQRAWPARIRVGLDLGSRAVKLMVAGPQGVLRRQTLEAVPFILNLRQAGTRALQDLELDPAWPLVTTGYGRAAWPGLSGISEIRAHFRGALAQSGHRDFTLLELGGQDSKVIQVQGGRVMDFITNDRCAAGTGRYLENMARLLGVGLEQLAQAQQEPVEINNTCATFGETELLGRLVEGADLEAIMAGVNLSVARRAAQMLRRYRPRLLLFCGGVALNQGVVKFIGDLLDCQVEVLPEAQMNGAWGCCLEEESI